MLGRPLKVLCVSDPAVCGKFSTQSESGDTTESTDEGQQEPKLLTADPRVHRLDEVQLVGWIHPEPRRVEGAGRLRVATDLPLHVELRDALRACGDLADSCRVDASGKRYSKDMWGVDATVSHPATGRVGRVGKGGRRHGDEERPGEHREAQLAAAAWLACGYSRGYTGYSCNQPYMYEYMYSTCSTIPYHTIH